MADRVLSELAGQRGRLILVTGERHEPTSHELTSPDALAQLTRLLTNLPGDVPAVLATVHDVSKANQEVIRTAPPLWSRLEKAHAAKPFR